MSELLEEGYHRMVYEHFGVDEEFGRRIPKIADGLTRYVESLLTALIQSGDESKMHECYLLKEAFRLIDEHVKPQTINQLAYCTFVTSTILSTLAPMLHDRAAMIREERFQRLQNHPIYGSNTATA
ncbi:hypothetical protein [Fibrisoma montanum]|nr:hypothetical protein [Fibrisoma montanum]